MPQTYEPQWLPYDRLKKTSTNPSFICQKLIADKSWTKNASVSDFLGPRGHTRQHRRYFPRETAIVCESVTYPPYRLCQMIHSITGQ
jgi:hypothetical protein